MFSAATKGGKNNAGIPNATLTVVGSAGSTANATTYTFNSVDIGAEDPNRVVAIAVQTQVSVSTVTINGVSATVYGGTSAAIAYANIPTGTTATIVVTNSASTSRTYIDCFRIVPGQSTAPYFNGLALSTTKNINAPKGGVGLFLSVNTANNNSFTTTWSGSDVKTSSGATNGSSNFYWVIDYFATPFASTYTGTLTSAIASRTASITWR